MAYHDYEFRIYRYMNICLGNLVDMFRVSLHVILLLDCLRLGTRRYYFVIADSLHPIDIDLSPSLYPINIRLVTSLRLSRPRDLYDDVDFSHYANYSILYSIGNGDMTPPMLSKEHNEEDK